MCKTTLICLPYAGGSSNMYTPLKKHISSDVTVLAVELKGRGSRISEDLIDNFDEMIEDIINGVLKENIQEYALFGYSMGGMLAYELAFKLEKELGNKPKAIFFAGNMPPRVTDDKNLHLLNDKDLIKYLENLGGLSPDSEEYPKLLEIFLPIIKSDLKISNDYEKHKKGIKDLGTNIHILYSDDDNKDDGIWEWENYTSKECEFYKFQDGHFFINHHCKEVADIINLILQ